MHKFQNGDIVTLNVGSGNFTNTFLVDSVFEENGSTFCLLYHPLAPETFIKKSITDINTNMTVFQKSPLEKCLYFVNKNNNLLDYDNSCETRALNLHFAVHRVFSNSQKQKLSNICGHIAAIKLDGNLEQMIKLVNENKALLDDFNLGWYSTYESFFTGKEKIKFKNHRTTIINIAGFVLAQLDN